jgi:predicted ATP-dependent serine protease
MASGMLRIETRIETTSQLRAWIRREVEKFKADLICVDYIQLVRSSDVKGAEIFEQVTEASRAITRAAREFNVPILCVSMMSEQGLWGSRQLDYDAYATLEMRTESVPEAPDFIKDIQCFYNKNRFGPEHFGIDFKLYGRVGRMEEVNAARMGGTQDEA